MNNEKNPINNKALAVSQTISIILNVAISAGILFLAAETINWLYGWIYILSYIAFRLISMFLSLKHVRWQNTRPKRSFMDQVISTGYNLTHPITLFLAGFEYRLTGNSIAFGEITQIVAVVFLFLIFSLLIWAQVENPNYNSLSTETKKELEIIATGPYQFIRHPGYAGLFMLALARPIVLGSRLGILPAIVGAFLMLLQTVREDYLLQKEHTEYKEYTEKVKHRMFSGIW